MTDASAAEATTTPAFGVHSEVGQLRKVLVCAPGLAHHRLTPTNADDLLFDDVMWVDNAQRDHADFVDEAARAAASRSSSCTTSLAETVADPGGAGVAARSQDRAPTRSASAWSTRPARSSSRSTPRTLAEFLIGGLADLRPARRLPHRLHRARPRVDRRRANT